MSDSAGRATEDLPVERIRHAVRQIDAARRDTRMDDAAHAWLVTIRSTVVDDCTLRDLGLA